MSRKFPFGYIMEDRLIQLFDRLNDRYWNGKLPPRHVQYRPMTRYMGLCSRSKPVIWVDVFRHHSARHLTETLLHEAVHSAEPPYICGLLHHNRGFFEEAEHVLRKDAPPGFLWGAFVEWPLDPVIVPARLEHLRQALTKLVRRSTVGPHKAEERRSVPEATIVREFRRAATRCVWKDAYWTLGAKFGLIDISGNPLVRRARQLLDIGKDAYFGEVALNSQIFG